MSIPTITVTRQQLIDTTRIMSGVVTSLMLGDYRVEKVEKLAADVFDGILAVPFPTPSPLPPDTGSAGTAMTSEACERINARMACAQGITLEENYHAAFGEWAYFASTIEKQLMDTRHQLEQARRERDQAVELNRINLNRFQAQQREDSAELNAQDATIADLRAQLTASQSRVDQMKIEMIDAAQECREAAKLVSETATELASLRAQLEQQRETREALIALRDACKDVLLPAINEAIRGGYKMETWTPEQMQFAKAVELTERALTPATGQDGKE